MVHSTTKVFRVFYSWQSDLPDAVNGQLIRSGLSAAATEINEDPDSDYRVLIDEATRGLSGSPNIPASIFAKICQADAFVCDLTKTVETEISGEVRKFCNPNVAIELGFAIRELGWERIITVFNTAYGKLPDDLPFDAKVHRAMPYECLADYNGTKPSSICNQKIKNAKGLLRTQLRDAIQLIQDKSPQRGSIPALQNAADMRRDRDVRQLGDILYWINPQVMDSLLDAMGYGRLTFIAWEFRENLALLISRTSFHLNDKELESRIRRFLRTWRSCYKYVMEMERNEVRQEFYFYLPGDMFQSDEQEEHFDYVTDRRRPLRGSLDLLLKHVRENYTEFDVTSIGKEAVEEYVKRKLNSKQTRL